MRRIKSALLLVVNGHRVEHKLTVGGLVRTTMVVFQFDDADVKLARIVAGIINQGDLIGINEIVVGAAKSPGYLDIIGVGTRI